MMSVVIQTGAVRCAIIGMEATIAPVWMVMNWKTVATHRNSRPALLLQVNVKAGQGERKGD